jgi:hypothetical protein
LRKAFGRIVGERWAEASNRWLEAAKDSEVAEPKGFAQGPIKDYEAVRVALTHEWGNGQIEVQINRLKMIKRQVYGRANLDLLKARFLHAVWKEYPTVTRGPRLQFIEIAPAPVFREQVNEDEPLRAALSSLWRRSGLPTRSFKNWHWLNSQCYTLRKVSGKVRYDERAQPLHCEVNT